MRHRPVRPQNVRSGSQPAPVNREEFKVIIEPDIEDVAPVNVVIAVVVLVAIGFEADAAGSPTSPLQEDSSTSVFFVHNSVSNGYWQ